MLYVYVRRRVHLDLGVDASAQRARRNSASRYALLLSITAIVLQHQKSLNSQIPVFSPVHEGTTMPSADRHEKSPKVERDVINCTKIILRRGW